MGQHEIPPTHLQPYAQPPPAPAHPEQHMMVHLGDMERAAWEADLVQNNATSQFSLHHPLPANSYEGLHIQKQVSPPYAGIQASTQDASRVIPPLVKSPSLPSSITTTSPLTSNQSNVAVPQPEKIAFESSTSSNQTKNSKLRHRSGPHASRSSQPTSPGSLRRISESEHPLPSHSQMAQQLPFSSPVLPSFRPSNPPQQHLQPQNYQSGTFTPSNAVQAEGESATSWLNHSEASPGSSVPSRPHNRLSAYPTIEGFHYYQEEARAEPTWQFSPPQAQPAPSEHDQHAAAATNFAPNNMNYAAQRSPWGEAPFSRKNFGSSRSEPTLHSGALPPPQPNTFVHRQAPIRSEEAISSYSKALPTAQPLNPNPAAPLHANDFSLPHHHHHHHSPYHHQQQSTMNSSPGAQHTLIHYSQYSQSASSLPQYAYAASAPSEAYSGAHSQSTSSSSPKAMSPNSASQNALASLQLAPSHYPTPVEHLAEELQCGIPAKKAKMFEQNEIQQSARFPPPNAPSLPNSATNVNETINTTVTQNMASPNALIASPPNEGKQFLHSQHSPMAHSGVTHDLDDNSSDTTAYWTPQS